MSYQTNDMATIYMLAIRLNHKHFNDLHIYLESL